MSALAVDQGIRKKFAQVYKHIQGLRVLEDDPFPTQTNTSFVANNGEDSHCPPLTLEFPRVGNAFDRVMVFLENERGHSHDFKHHVSFQNVRGRWRTEEGASGRDVDCCGTTTAVNSQGETVYGPDLVINRPQAQPESLYYDFHIESRNYSFVQEILAVVKGLFPARGFLTIQFQDKSVHDIDMIRTTNAFRSSTFDATLSSGDPGVRKYRWTMQYEVESYDDNTMQGQWKQTITSNECAAGHDLDLLPRT